MWKMLESIYLTRNEPIFNYLSGNAPYYNFLLCLMPDDFTCQVESAATQWVQLHIAPYFICYFV
jgi:hypothetical protein